MPEIRQQFRSHDEWTAWAGHYGNPKRDHDAVIADIQKLGLVEPLTGMRRLPHQISIRPANLHESISSHQLNSRKRALLLQIESELKARQWENRLDLKILGAECLTRIALILRGIYPCYLGTEYLPDEKQQRAKFPIPHMDLQNIQYETGTFDGFVSGDVFEHIPDLDTAIREILRVLKPGGLLVSSFPFSPSRVKTEIRASLGPSGELVHHAAPEYHGNPVDPAAGSLVFQYPGWDLLDKLKDWGCSDAYYTTVMSSRFGVASNGIPGPFILTAQKAGGSGSALKTVPNFFSRFAWPDKLCTLLALPRSGTTLLSSMFAVHSQVEASYEPWNSKILRTGEPADATIEAIATAEKLPPLAGKILFVKETALDNQYVAAIRKLHEQTPAFVERHSIFLMRAIEHTLLSEVERRNEWWDASVTINHDFIVKWAKNRGAALREVIDFTRASGGLLVAFEEVTARPEAMMRRLADMIGFHFEREQIEYEKHMQSQKVRGDLNVSRNPEKIDPGRAMARQDKVAALAAMVESSPAAPWFAACRALHDHAVAAGGIVRMADVPKPVLEELGRT